MNLDASKNRARDLYLSGMSMNAVGKELGVTGPTIRRWLDLEGVPIRYSRPTYSEGVRKEAIRLYQADGLSAEKVARALGIKSFTVKEWIASAGVSRSMSEAASLAVARGDTVARRRGTHVWYESAKTGKGQYAESSIEYLRMRQLDSDSSVSTWGRCRRRIPYVAPNGKQRHYVPDFEVVSFDGSISIEEIKPLHQIDHPLNQSKFAAARSYCDQRGISFCVKTEKETGYSRSLTPFFLEPADQRQRANQLRQERWSSETPWERKARLKRNADYMREYNRRRRQC